MLDLSRWIPLFSLIVVIPILFNFVFYLLAPLFVTYLIGFLFSPSQL